ncbi:MAG: hypothetical protein RLZZ488_2163 [Pseudomonadota bacterium]|jgi:tetratricopeptide (TPR) repeat protein
MGGVFDKKYNAWQLPDSAPKADERDSEAVPENEKNSSAPSFEIDFSVEQAAQQQNAQVESKESPATAVGDSDSIPALEIGQPGQFVSAQFDHGLRLDDGVASTDSTRASSPLVMVDEPLPESLGGGAGLQDMFVAEVLRGIQTAPDDNRNTMIASPGSEVFALPADGSTLISGAAFVASEDKTQITEETKAFNSQVGEGVVGSGDEKTIATSVATPDSAVTAQAPLDTSSLFVAPQYAPPPAAQIPSPPPQAPSPAPSKMSEVISPAASAKASGANSKSESTQAGGKATEGKEEKTKAGNTKAGTAQGKDKGAAAGKKPAAGQGAKGKPNDGGSGETNAGQTFVQSMDGKSAAPAAARGLSKEQRILLGMTIFAMLLIALLITKRMSKVDLTQGMSTEIASPTQSETPGAGKSRSGKDSKENKKAPGKGGKTDAQVTPSGKDKKELSAKEKSSPNIAAGTNKKMQAVAGDASSDSKGEDGLGEPDDDSLELENILTRPVSRYSESNKLLIPLIEVSLALDRAQPRRVFSLIKTLPAEFGKTDPLQKAALREITARFYMQVGAYQKAYILFRQACNDPAKSSEVETCLHAARSYLVMGNEEDANTVIDALELRMNGANVQWREWLKLLTVAARINERTLEVFVNFTDDLADKGPFLTTEWNLQLSAMFARKFLQIGDRERISYLSALDNTRKKNIEVRLAPEKFGQDIGSYMLPAFLNLMMRHYEFPMMTFLADEPDMDSDLAMSSWIFNSISQAKASEPRETRARLSPLFAERGFSSIARLIEGQLAAQAGDYIGAHAMILEQIGPNLSEEQRQAGGKFGQLQTRQFINATQRMSSMPYLFVEWLFLGIKVAAGLNDRESLKTYIVALEDARRRFPELSNEIQYWILSARAHRVLGQVSAVEAAVAQASRLAVSKNDLGFVGADRVWVMMRQGKTREAKQLAKQLIREIPHHARLLELAAEFSAPWGEEPSAYLRLEAEIPIKFQTRGRDSVLLSLFTIRKILNSY